MTPSSPAHRYCVMGNPIAHSQSPWIHAAFARQSGLSLEYEARLVAEDGFKEAVDSALNEGLSGFNVTVPFKQQAAALAGSVSERVKRAGAANTLWFEHGQLYADNTDGPGLVRDLSVNLGWAIAGRRVLLLGAGGAVRGVVEPILRQQPEVLTIANRTPQKAAQVAAIFADIHTLSYSGFDDLTGTYDLIINGTSASLQGDTLPIDAALLGADCACYDMMYASSSTPFMAWAAANGCARTADGLGMLVEQAAAAFEIWHGLRPRTEEVIPALRARLADNSA